jgi:hypothetical protein
MLPNVKESLLRRSKMLFVKFADYLSRPKEVSHSTKDSSTLWNEMKSVLRLLEKGMAKYGPMKNWIK